MELKKQIEPVCIHPSEKYTVNIKVALKPWTVQLV